MMVNCGVNGEVLEESQIFVCHHCGMPVCEAHGWVVASDDAFADSDLLASKSLLRAESVPRPAMHCRECVDKFHGGAVKRHGWADPQSADRT